MTTPNLRILVTGATGCLGTPLVGKLAGLSHQVIALVRKSAMTAAIRDVAGLTIVEGDTQDPQTFASAVGPLDIVIHAAARTTFARARGRDDDFADNVESALRVAEVAAKNGARHFILISSCSAMGDLYDGERDENSPCTPDSHYGRSKLAGEAVIKTSCDANRLPWTILRPTLIYGPHDRGAVRKIISYIDRERWVILGNGRNQKSFVNVQNVVDAILCVIAHERAFGEVYIVTDGKSYSINEFCAEVAHQLGRRSRFRHVPRSLALTAGVGCDFLERVCHIKAPLSHFEVKKFLSSNTFGIRKIIEHVGFSPAHSLRDGISAAVQQYQLEKGEAATRSIASNIEGIDIRRAEEL